MGKYGLNNKSLLELFSNKHCSYCNKNMLYPYDKNNRKDSATIEHLNNNGPFYVKDGLHIKDIVIVCGSCNSSRGTKDINIWFKTSYCVDKNINEKTVSDKVKNYLTSK
jgi:hypothetical protein